jgi:hypothetical protein
VKLPSEPHEIVHRRLKALITRHNVHMDLDEELLFLGVVAVKDSRHAYAKEQSAAPTD